MINIEPDYLTDKIVDVGKSTKMRFHGAYDQGSTFREMRIITGTSTTLLYLTKKEIDKLIEGLEHLKKY